MNRLPSTRQQECSRETRTKVLDAAVVSLAEVGWHLATTSVIAQRAGVSRGALQHHFPTREELFLAALEHMFLSQIGRSHSAIAEEEDEDPFDVLVQQVLDYYASDLFKAALHVWTAAAAEPALRARILPLEEKFARGVYEMAVRALDADITDDRTRRLIQATLDLARGLGLADLLSDDSERRRKIAGFWAQELRSIKRRGSSQL